MKLKEFFSYFRYGTRSLKTVLAIYFIPVSVVPALFISIYATRVFEENTKEGLIRRASSERDAIVAEIESLEGELLNQARAHSKAPRLLQAVRLRNKEQITDILSSFRTSLQVRIYSPSGAFLADRKVPEIENEIAYISKEGLRRVKAKGETLERYFSTDSKGFVTVIRTLLKDKSTFYGILEEEYYFGQRDLADLKNRRQVDVVFMNRDFTSVAASFALSQNVIKSFSTSVFQSGPREFKEPIFISLGETRFAGFLYDLPAPFGKLRKWGYLALFIPMTTVDATVGKLKLAIIYLTALLILVTTLLIFIFSNRLVKPIVMLVAAMKRLKTGRVEQIPAIDSTYEIEYLVRSFNEMTRNVSAAKRALELKLEELHRANLEIKNTQGHLVQSAKMISLGRIVAGVAHELNNPIGFIYSNMHHLNEYLERIKKLVLGYREARASLAPKERQALDKLEKDLEIDFILRDMEELTRSCLEGAQRTKDIVLGLRTFSRMDESTFKPTDLHEGIRSTVKLLTTEFKDRVRVREEFGELPSVECNPSQMNQVFMNLLSNSAQAIEGKGDVWIRTRAEGEYVTIEIEDSGCGIAPDALEKIFDPFYTTKKVGQGTGLGLSIAYGLVQKHHGTITVQSKLKKGTKFIITLPIRQSVAIAS